ncbi:unnamed protein product [Musa hybrid cultivar]
MQTFPDLNHANIRSDVTATHASILFFLSPFLYSCHQTLVRQPLSELTNICLSSLSMLMAGLLLLLLTVSAFGGSDAAWCVCESDASTTALQKTLDYACGAGADCNPILQVGACYDPNTVLAHCSYAANSYYQRNGQAQTACDFSGTAMLTSTDPSANGCVYPATPSAAATSSTPTSTSTTPSSATPSTFSPLTSNTTNGVLGGIGPSGTTSSLDGSDGGLLRKAGIGSLLTVLLPILVLLKV